MFVHQPALESLAVSPGDILLLLISLNRPMVALEDYSTDEADATICTVRRESDMVSTVVHLLLQQGRVALFYRFESDPYPVDLRSPVEEEALDFVESLGFIMDDTRFAAMGPDERKALLERPIFTGALSTGAPPDPVARAFEVPLDPAFQFEPMTQERLDAIGPVAEAIPPVVVERPPADPSPGEEPFQIALPEASLQEMEIVLDEVFQDSGGTRAARRDSSKGVSAPPAVVAESGLSRFRRKRASADLVTLQAIGAEEKVAQAGEVAACTPAPISVSENPSSLESADLRPAEQPPADQDLRRRRARARYLASF